MTSIRLFRWRNPPPRVGSEYGGRYITGQLILPALRDSYEDTVAAAAKADSLVTHPLTFVGLCCPQDRDAMGVAHAGADEHVFRFDPPLRRKLIALRLLIRIPKGAAVEDSVLLGRSTWYFHKGVSSGNIGRLGIPFPLSPNAQFLASTQTARKI